MAKKDEGCPHLASFQKEEPTPASGKEHRDKQGGAHIQDSLSWSLLVSLLPEAPPSEGWLLSAAEGIPSEVTPMSFWLSGV